MSAIPGNSYNTPYSVQTQHAYTSPNSYAQPPQPIVANHTAPTSKNLVSVKNLPSALEFTHAIYDVARTYGLDHNQIHAIVESSHSLSRAMLGDTSGLYTTFAVSGIPDSHLEAFYEALSAKIAKTTHVHSVSGDRVNPAPRVFTPHVSSAVQNAANASAYQANFAPYLQRAA